MNFKCWLESTEDIQAWLGNSVIKTVVYHGTNKHKFDKFSIQKSKRYVLFSEFDVEAKGYFFAENPHDALEYGQNVAACYVKMVNPLLDPRRDPGSGRLPYVKEMQLMKILATMIQREKGEPYIDIGVKRTYLRNRNYNYAHQWIYEAVGPEGIEWDCLDNPQVVDRIKKLGFDGTFVQENNQYVGRSIFVPDADQVRIIEWVKGKQWQWGHKDDWYTKNVNGNYKLFQPDPKNIYPPEEDEDEDF